MTDTYPYFKPTKQEWYPESPDWFKIAMTVRDRALAYGIPYFTWLAAFQGKPGTPATAGTVPFSLSPAVRVRNEGERYTPFLLWDLRVFPGSATTTAMRTVTTGW